MVVGNELTEPRHRQVVLLSWEVDSWRRCFRVSCDASDVENFLVRPWQWRSNGKRRYTITGQQEPSQPGAGQPAGAALALACRHRAGSVRERPMAERGDERGSNH